MVLYMPAKARKAHANITPWHLKSNRAGTISSSHLLAQAHSKHTADMMLLVLGGGAGGGVGRMTESGPFFFVYTFINLPMQVIDRIAPMVFDVPAKARKTHADIAPRDL